MNDAAPKETAKIQAVVIDKNLDRERQCAYNFTFENGRIAIDDIFIDNEGKMVANLLKKEYLFLPGYSKSITKEDIIVTGMGILSKAGEFYLKRVRLKS